MNMFRQLKLPMLSILLSFSHYLSAADVPSTEAFFSNRTVDALRLSPDGQHLAITIPEEGKGRLAIVNISSNEVVAQFHTPKNQKIGNFNWANSERIVFNTVFYRGGLDIPFTTGELFALNIDDSRKFQLGGQGSGDISSLYFLNALEDDHEHIRVVSRPMRLGSARRRPTAYLLDIYKKPDAKVGGKTTKANLGKKTISPLRWGGLYTDNAGEVRLAMATAEDNNIQMRYRSSAKKDWVDIANDFSLGKDADKLEVSFVSFASDNKSIYFLKTEDHGTNALIRYYPKQHSTEIIYQHPSFDLYWSNIVYSLDGEQVIGVKFIGDGLEIAYFGDHPDIALHKRMDATFPRELVSINSADKQKDTVAVEVRGAQRERDFYLYDTEKESLTFVYGAQGPELNQKLMADVTPFAIRNKKADLILHGYVTTPLNAGENLPMVVIPHGGPIGVRDNFLFDREAHFFALNGYAVLHINYRGSGGYGNAFANAGYGQWGTGMIEDITLATQWAVNKKIADADRICIYGGSYGAFAALASVSQEPDRYQCAAGLAGVYDLSTLSRSDIKRLPGGKDYLARAVGTDKEELKRQSPLYHTDNIKVPVFIAHGGQDRRTPPSQAKGLRDALEKSGVEYKWMFKKGEGHGFYNSENRIEFYDELLSFIDEHTRVRIDENIVDSLNSEKNAP